MLFDKENRIRLNVSWTKLWESMIKLCEILAGDGVQNKLKSYSLVKQILRLFNMAITHGNLFLPSPKDYDELFYEFVRKKNTFDDLTIWIKLNFKGTLSNPTAPSSTTPAKNNAGAGLIKEMENIHLIISHFSGKLEAKFGESGFSNPDHVICSCPCFIILTPDFHKISFFKTSALPHHR